MIKIGNGITILSDFLSILSKYYFIFSEYGGLQEYVSFTMYENLARFGIKNGMLDTDLNKKYWESRFFQFYAGDLYEVIPKMA